jgi:thiazole synthase ThiGH ThiG subunit
VVLAASLHQARVNLLNAAHDLIQEGSEVYLFADDIPDYARRMEAIAFLTRMRMGWEDTLTLA